MNLNVKYLDIRKSKVAVIQRMLHYNYMKFSQDFHCSYNPLIIVSCHIALTTVNLEELHLIKLKNSNKLRKFTRQCKYRKESRQIDKWYPARKITPIDTAFPKDWE